MKLKFIILRILVFGLVLGPLYSRAQENESRIESQTNDKPAYKFLLGVDVRSMVHKGFGVGGDMALMDKVTIGAFFLQTKSNEGWIEKLFMESESEIKTYGFRTRFYFTRTFTESGWYIGAAAVKTELRVQAHSTLFGPGPRGSGSTEQSGAQGSLGYQFIGREINSGQFSMNLAYVYGAGNEFYYNYKSTNSGATVTPILKDGSSYEATLGWMF